MRKRRIPKKLNKLDDETAIGTALVLGGILVELRYNPVDKRERDRDMMFKRNGIWWPCSTWHRQRKLRPGRRFKTMGGRSRRASK